MAITFTDALAELLTSSGLDPADLADAAQLGAAMAEAGIDVSSLSVEQLDHLLEALRAGGGMEDDPTLLDALMDALPQDDEARGRRDG